MNEQQEFTIGQILSITTGVLLCEEGDFDYPMLGIYEILNYMTEDDLMRYQLPRASGQVKPYLCEQFPWADVPSETVTSWGGGWKGFLNDITEKHGKYHTVRRIHREDQTHHDPITELQQMMDGRNVEIITINVDEDIE